MPVDPIPWVDHRSRNCYTSLVRLPQIVSTGQEILLTKLVVALLFELLTYEQLPLLPDELNSFQGD